MQRVLTGRSVGHWAPSPARCRCIVRAGRTGRRLISGRLRLRRPMPRPSPGQGMEPMDEDEHEYEQDAVPEERVIDTVSTHGSAGRHAAWGDADDTEDSSGQAAAAAADSRLAAASALPSGVKLALGVHSKAKAGGVAISVQEEYAFRNPDVLQALQLLGQQVELEDNSGVSPWDPNDRPALRSGLGATNWMDSPSTNSASDSDSDTSAPPHPGSSGIAPVDDDRDIDITAGGDWAVRTSPSGEVFLERSTAARPQRSRTSAPAPRPTPAQALRPQLQATQPVGTKPAMAAAAFTGSGAAKGLTFGDNMVQNASRASPAVLHPLFGGPSVGVGALKTALKSLVGPEQVLDLAALLWPAWAEAGCRLAAPAVLVVAEGQSTGGLGVVPTPAEAAVVLQGVALSARKAGWGTARRRELCTDVRVIGLNEALRVTPPRLTPDQEAIPALAKGLKAAFFKAARAWWLTPPPLGSTAAATTNTTNTASTTTNDPANGAVTAGPLINGHSWASMSHTSSVGAQQQQPLQHTGATAMVDGAPQQPLNGLNGLALNGLVNTGVDGMQGVNGVQAFSGDVQGVNGDIQSINGDVQGLGKGQHSGPGQEYEALLERYRAAGSGGQFRDRKGQPQQQQGMRHPRKDINEVVQCRNQSVVSAISAMATLAGASQWSSQMNALLSVAVAGGVRWDQLAPGEAGSLTWALAVARHWSHALERLDKGMAQAGGLSCLQPDETSRLLWGYATLNMVPTHLMDSLSDEWAWRQGARGGDLHSFTTTQLAQCCWSLAVLRQTAHPAFKAAWQGLLSRGTADLEHAGHIVLTQVWQVAMAIWLDPHCPPDNHQGQSVATTSTAVHGADPATTQGGDAVTACIAATTAHVSHRMGHIALGLSQEEVSQVLRAAHAAFASGSSAVKAGGKARGGGHSGAQRQMANAVTILRHLHVVEDTSSGYAIDVSLPRLKVAIEADGPTHFSRTVGPTGKGTSSSEAWVLGPTAMKRRHLEALGWAVVSINTLEWEAAAGPMTRTTLMEKRIGRAVAERMEKAAAAVLPALEQQQ